MKDKEAKRFLIIDNLNKSNINDPLSELAKKYACVLYSVDNFKDPTLPVVKRKRTKRSERRNTSHDGCHSPRSRTSNRPYYHSHSDMSEADDTDQETYHPSRHHRVHKSTSIDSSTDSQTSSIHNSVPRTPLPDELLTSLKNFINQMLLSQQSQKERNVESSVNQAVDMQTLNELRLDEPMHHVVVQSSADSNEKVVHVADQHSDGTSNKETSEFGAVTTHQALNESPVQECMDVTELQKTVAQGIVVKTAIVQMETDDTELNDCLEPAVVSELISTEHNLVEMETNHSENGFVEKPIEVTVNAVIENVSEQSPIDVEELNHISSSSREDSEVQQPQDCPTQVTQPFVYINIAQTTAPLPQQSESPEKNDEEVIAQVNDTNEIRPDSSSVPIGITPPTPTVLITGVALQEQQICQAISQNTEARNNLQAAPYYLIETPHGRALLNEDNVRGLYPVQLTSRTDSSPIHPVIPLPAPNPSLPQIFSQIPVIPRNQPMLQQEGQIQFPQNLVHQPTLSQFLQHQQNMIHAQLMMHHKPMIAQHPPNMMNWNLMEPVRAPIQPMNANLSSPIWQRVGRQNPNQLLSSPALTSRSQSSGSDVNSNMSAVHQKIRTPVLKEFGNDPSKESGYKPPTGSTAAPQHVLPATGSIPTVIPADFQSSTGNVSINPRKRKHPEIAFRPVVQMINVGASISDQELIASQNEAIRNNLPACPPGLYQLGRPLSKNGLVRFYRKDSLERGVELSLPTQPDCERTYRELFTDGRVLLSNLNHQPGWKIGVKGFDPSIREKMKQPNAQTVPTMYPKLQHHGVQNVHPRRRQNETVQMVQQDDNEEHKAKVARLKQNMGPITENRVAVFNTPRPFQGEIVERRQVVAAPSDDTAIQKKKKIAPFTSISDYQDRKNGQNAQVEFIDLTGDEEGETTVGMESSIQNISISSDRQNHVGKVVLETAEPRQLQQSVSDQEDKPRAEQPEPFNQPNPTKHFFPPDYKKHEANKAPRARILKIAPLNPYPLIAPVRRTKQKHTNFQLTRLKEVYEMYKQNQVSKYDYAKLGHPINLAAFQVKQYINNQKAKERRNARKNNSPPQ